MNAFFKSGKLVLAGMLAFLCAAFSAKAETLRIGHFPNITHGQALIAHALSRAGRGWFEARLPAETKIEWYVYNAGPSAMEALLADSIDLTYVGPNPAINAYVRAKGEDIRIVAGAANGGAALVVQPELEVKGPADLKGKRIATPQFGNTQDVAARAWLRAGGLRITQTGGDAFVIPTANPDQLTLFKSKAIDAVWTVEPWVSRLESEAGGKVVLEERDSITTVVVTSQRSLTRQRPLLQAFARAHAELTDWMMSHADEAQTLIREEIEQETRAKLSPELVARSLARIEPTAIITRAALEEFLVKAKTAGFLREANDLARLVEAP